ncbi:hypothetical protein BKG82_27215 [Mycobacteroides chelonae]|uniref:Uncharacterized protein n=1 Tax=Mycobacteroides chelonae TaxID=1774 RepID=A0A1S1LL63_MYCCH|nr:hypothetical protein [Mycobacteroides chelonae]OHU47344.1 hypothetical protein BKG82_27215 [Mycobacteroides chelonae]
MNRPTDNGYPDPSSPDAIRFAGNVLRALGPAFASLGLPAARLDIMATLREAQLADEQGNHEQATQLRQDAKFADEVRQHIFGNS